MWTFKGQSAFLASELGFLGQPDTYVFWKSFLDQRRHFLNILALNSGATGCKKYANRFIALIFYALSAVIIKNFTKWSMRGRWRSFCVSLGWAKSDVWSWAKSDVEKSNHNDLRSSITNGLLTDTGENV